MNTTSIRTITTKLNLWRTNRKLCACRPVDKPHRSDSRPASPSPQRAPSTATRTGRFLSCRAFLSAWPHQDRTPWCPRSFCLSLDSQTHSSASREKTTPRSRCLLEPSASMKSNYTIYDHPKEIIKAIVLYFFFISYRRNTNQRSASLTQRIPLYRCIDFVHIITQKFPFGWTQWNAFAAGSLFLRLLIHLVFSNLNELLVWKNVMNFTNKTLHSCGRMCKYSSTYIHTYNRTRASPSANIHVTSVQTYIYACIESFLVYTSCCTYPCTHACIRL